MILHQIRLRSSGTSRAGGAVTHAIYAETGEILATSRATWIILNDEQRQAFRSARP